MLSMLSAPFAKFFYIYLVFFDTYFPKIIIGTATHRTLQSG